MVFRNPDTHLLSLIYSNPQERSEQEFHRSARCPWMNLTGSAVSPTDREQRQEDPMGDPRPAVANNRIEFLSSFILISAETGLVVSKQHGSRNHRHAEPLLACPFQPIPQPRPSLVVTGTLRGVESKQNHLGTGIKFQNTSS